MFCIALPGKVKKLVKEINHGQYLRKFVHKWKTFDCCRAADGGGSKATFLGVFGWKFGILYGKSFDCHLENYFGVKALNGYSRSLVTVRGHFEL